MKFTKNLHLFLPKTYKKVWHLHKECNHSIGIQHYKKRKKNYTVCNYYRKYGAKKEICTAHRFVYEDLETLVLKNIKKECLHYVDSTNFVEKLKEQEQSKQLKNDLKISIDKAKNNIKKLEKMVDTIYQDKLDEIIDSKQYKRLVENKRKDIEFEKKKLERFYQDLKAIKNKNISTPNYDKIVKDFLELKKPNKIMLGKLIEVIYLNEEGTIDIHYKIQKPHKKSS